MGKEQARGGNSEGVKREEKKKEDKSERVYCEKG